jgi:hypothetical protein
MANNLQMDACTRQSMIAAYITSVGTLPKLIFRSGTQPGACASVDSGTMLGILTLPSTWQSSASGVTTIANGPWTGTGAAAGTIGHYRLKDSSATATDNSGTTKEQGTVGTSASDINVDNLVVASGQTISISSWTRTQGGA